MTRVGKRGKRTVISETHVPAERDAFLKVVARSRPIVTKESFVLGRCRGRTVLDVGCINHSAATALALGDRWLHKQLTEVAASVVGLDFLAEDAAVLNEAGYAIEVADAERFDLSRQFDVVVAGDVLEHLANLGEFLERARSHMHPASDLVITTPNPFSFAQMMQVLIRRRVVVNREHRVWLDPSVIFELLEKSGFRITEFSWIDSDPEFVPTTLATKILAAVSRTAGWLQPLCRPNYGVVAQIAP
jgi:2-polyprenyl-3-methyl-5-hydroxy-6-metoxy-1,4-benzoquinol methylase